MPLSILDNFYLTDEQLENSPSRQHGIDRETEATLRVYGCELIQEAGVLLRFPQAAMATGQVLFHRFYCKRSMKDFNVKARTPRGRPGRGGDKACRAAGHCAGSGRGPQRGPRVAPRAAT
ncbi:MAG: cyclin-like protein, partial [Monoraphidium minutum]